MGDNYLCLRYNITMTQETKNKISAAHMGRKFTEEHKAKLRAARANGRFACKNHPMFGKHHTEESKRLNSEKHLGNTSWNKGLKISLESRRKMSIAQTGKTGEKSSHWMGGLTKETQKMRNSDEYKAWRTSVFERDSHTCQVCLLSGGYLHADHIVSWSDNFDLRYDVANGRTLCRPCHYYVTFKRQMPSGSKWGARGMKFSETITST
jgi:hypothetical protein